MTTDADVIALYANQERLSAELRRMEDLPVTEGVDHTDPEYQGALHNLADQVRELRMFTNLIEHHGHVTTILSTLVSMGAVPEFAAANTSHLTYVFNVAESTQVTVLQGDTLLGSFPARWMITPLMEVLTELGIEWVEEPVVESEPFGQPTE
jgi:hypothetical protein